MEDVRKNFSGRIVARHEMAEHQHLDAGGSGDAADVLGRRVALQQVFLQRRTILVFEHQAIDRGHKKAFVHQYVGALGELCELGIVIGIA